MTLLALSSVSSQQLIAAEDTNKDIKRCLDYLIAFPNETITYEASDIALWAHSYGAFMVEDEANSR